MASAAIGLMVHAIVELATAVDRLTGWQVARKNLDRHLAEAVPEAAAGQVRLARGTGAQTMTAGADVLHPARLQLLPGDRCRNLCLGLTDPPSDATLTRRIKRADLTRTLDEIGGLDGAVPEVGTFLGPAFRLRLATLGAAVQRPSLLLVDDGGQALPQDLQGYVDGSQATVVKIGAGLRQSPAEA